MWQSIRWSRDADSDSTIEAEHTHDESANTALIVVKLLFGILLVVASSVVLIPAVKIVAERVRVPESIIAATLVAFGTSLPEFVTAVTAARRGHGALAVGNVIGADILNVLFVRWCGRCRNRRRVRSTDALFSSAFPTDAIYLNRFSCWHICFGRQVETSVWCHTYRCIPVCDDSELQGYRRLKLFEVSDIA